jgi:hypothetical protein
MRDLLIGLALVGVLAVGLPVGLAIAGDWTPRETSSLLTGTFAVCGSGIALFAIAAGLAIGHGLTRRRQRDAQPTPGAATYQVGDIDELRRQRQIVDLQRARLALERDRRSLLPAAPEAINEPAYWTIPAEWAEIDD